MSRASETIQYAVEGVELPPLPELFKDATLLRGSTSTASGEAFRLELGGRSFIVKSFARKGTASRFLWGRASIGREWKNLLKLREMGFDCAPQPVALIGRYTLVAEFIEGCEICSREHYCRHSTPPPAADFYDALRAILRALHEKGVAHGDFRRANIMIQEGTGTPRIIDWATGTVSKNRRGLLFKLFKRSDSYSLVKIIGDIYPELVSEDERKSVRPGILLRIGRFLRQNVYRKLIKPMFGHSNR